MKNRGRLDHIDALRGFAALFVVVQHTLEIIANKFPPDGAVATAIGDISHNYINWGKVGVVAFFAISGFVIPFSLKEPNYLPVFVVRRFFRLYPSYWLSILAALILLPRVSSAHFSAKQILANITMLQTALRQPDIIAVYWTLFIELIFYGMCAAAFSKKLLSSTTYLSAITVGCLVGALGLAFLRFKHPASGAPIAIPLSLAIMHFGTVARLATESAAQKVRTSYFLNLAAFCGAILPICYLGYVHEGRHEPWLAVALSYSLGVMIFVFVVFRRTFASGPAVFLGAISYALYLFHGLVLHTVEYLAKGLGEAEFAITLALAVPTVSLIVAAAVHYSVERPAIIVGHNLTQRIGRRPVAQPSVI